LVSGERPRSTIFVEYGWAWCVWPTVIHVEDLHLAVDGARFQFELRLPRGVVDIELRKLLERRLETTSIDGTGAQIAFSIKRPHGTDEAQIEGYHRIEGFPPPILDATPRPVPAREKSWEVILHDLDTSIRELRVNGFELQFEGQLAGALDVQLAHQLRVPQLLLEIQGGSVRRLHATLAEEITGSLDLAVASYNPEQLRGREALRMLSGTVELQAHVPGFGWLTDLRQLPLELRGAGSLTCDLELDEGVFVAGSIARFETPEIIASHTLKSGPISLQTAAEIEVRARNNGGLAVTGSLTELQGRVNDAKKPSLTAEKLMAAASFATASLVDGPGERTSVSVELPKFKLGNLRALGSLSEGVRVRGGHFAGHATAKISKENVYTLNFAVDFNQLSLAKNKLSLQTDGYIRSEGTIAVKGDRVEFPPVHAKIHGLSLTSKRGGAVDGWVEVQRAGVRYSRDSQRLEVEAHGRSENLRTLLAHVRDGKDIFERSPNAGLGTRPVEYILKLSRTPKSMQIDVSKLDGGPIDALAAIAKTGDEFRSTVYLRRARIGIVNASGGPQEIKLAAGREWFTKKAAWVHGLAREAP